jgi:hypothetical protein
MGWAVWGSNPAVGEIFRTIQNGPVSHPASYAIGTGSFPGVQQPGRGIDHPPHLARRLKKGYSCRFTLLLCLHGILQDKLYLFCLVYGAGIAQSI